MRKRKRSLPSKIITLTSPAGGFVTGKEIMMNDKAVGEYLNQLNRARVAINRINQYLDDNGEQTPEQINWGSVGSMEHLANELNHLKDMIDCTGEYAR